MTPMPRREEDALAGVPGADAHEQALFVRLEGELGAVAQSVIRLHAVRRWLARVMHELCRGVQYVGTDFYGSTAARQQTDSDRHR